MRRWQATVVVILVVAIAATWQQGLLQDGIEDLRGYDRDTSLSGTSERNEFATAPARSNIPISSAFHDDWIAEVSGESDSTEREGEANASALREVSESERFRVLAQTNNATLFAGSTVGVEPTDIEMSIIPSSENASDTDGLLGNGVEIKSDVEASGEYILTLALPDEPAADSIPGVWHVGENNQASFVPGVWDIDANTITVYVQDFSKFWGGWWNPLNWIYEATDFVFDYLTGRTDPPPCRNDAPFWASLRKEELSSVHICLQSSDPIDGIEAVEILIKSNRATLQLMEVPRTKKNLWVDLQTDWMRPLLVDLATIVETTWFNERSQRDTSVLLFGGQTMSYSLARPAQDVQIAAHAYQTIAIGFANLIFSVIGGMELNEELVAMLALSKCAYDLVIADGGSIEASTNLLTYLEPLLACILNLIQNPQLAADVATETANLVGLSDNIARAAGDNVLSTLDSGRMKGVAKTLGKITAVASLVVNAWDATFDSLAKSRMTVSLIGNPSLSESSPHTQIDFDAIQEITGETPVILIADTSGSMDEIVDGQVKLELAKASMLEFLSTVSPTRQVALRTFPSTQGGECNSGELWIDFSPPTFAMRTRVRSLYADGDTPTAEALQAAVEDIRRAGISQAEIALFSDGLANCADPCAVANDIVATGIDIRVHTGAFVDSEEGRGILRCISDATGGTYVESSGQESEFAEELGEFLERNSIPRLEIALEVPDTVAPSTGPAEQQQRVDAVVRNDSNVAAKDVVVSLEVDGGPEPTRRSVAIGNIAPGAEETASWELRPSFGSVGADLALGVSVVADNTKKVVSTFDAVAVENLNNPEDAGPIVGVGQVVVMGDQLLTGVGSNGRDADGSCRKGRNIGLLEVFGQDSERSLACANALIAHLTAPDWAKGVDSQINQLAVLLDEGNPINGVILSIGATDLGLSELTQECVLSIVSCDSEISGMATEDWLEGSIAGSGPRRNSVLSELVRSFGAVDQELNAAMGESRQAPILLLAQPRAFSFVSGACFERWHGGETPLLTQAELNLYHYFVSAVNGTLEAAALAAQELGLPVLFVDATETAYLPDHTACSSQPYVRSLEPLFEAGPDSIAALVEQGIPGVVGEELNEDAVAEFSEEFLAPNLEGEQALANAVLRWSRSDEALIANNAMNDRFVQRSAGVAADLLNTSQDYETLTLGSDRSITLESGQGWNVEVSGFLPGSLVTASVKPSGRFLASSVADRRGTANLYMVLGPEEAALEEAAIVVKGRGRSGAAVSGAQPVEVLPPLRPLYSLILPALAALLLLGSLLLWRLYALKRGRRVRIFVTD
ncbi:MAG: VWA domain-containing protein [bacterium]|nr:VWA domain-containing protein [bacterium]MCY4134173.1 VWA domain-containing protein [bacterium]